MNSTLPSSQVSQRLNVAISMEMISSRTQNKSLKSDYQPSNKFVTAVSTKMTVTPLQSSTKLKEFGLEQPMRRESETSEIRRSEVRKSLMFLKNYQMALLLKRSPKCKESKSPQLSDYYSEQSNEELSNESQIINTHYCIIINFTIDPDNNHKWNLVSIKETYCSNDQGFRGNGNERSGSNRVIDRSIVRAQISSLFPEHLDEGKSDESSSCKQSIFSQGCRSITRSDLYQSWDEAFIRWHCSNHCSTCLHKPALWRRKLNLPSVEVLAETQNILTGDKK